LRRLRPEKKAAVEFGPDGRPRDGAVSYDNPDDWARGLREIQAPPKSVLGKR
jgi:hypothetical protein